MQTSAAPVAPSTSFRQRVLSGDITALNVLRVGSELACISLVDGRRVALAGPVQIGRAAECELILADHSVSRLHTRLDVGPDGVVTIVDLGSSNGTFVDGRRITRAEITGSSVLRVGDCVLRIATRAAYEAGVDERSEARGDGAGDHEPLVGGSSLAQVRRMVRLVAPTELPVLVLGETGTGKDVVARALHAASRRRGPFVAVSCAALTDPAQRFADALGGTLFLDELGELPAATQTQLTCLLEARLDVRVVSASNRDLHALGFRPDLLARLGAVELRLPPLRNRVEDLPALVQALWRRAQDTPVTITANALEALALYAWPHNVRELDHVLRAAALIDRDVVDLAALSDPIRDRLREARHAAITRPKPPADLRATVEAALRDHHGNLRRVAQLLGIARGHLYRLLKRWQLDPATFRGAA